MNNKIAFIFPGQGSQYVAMGKEFYDNFKESREVFDISNKLLRYNLSQLIFEGTLEELSQTKITQPAILTTSIAILEALRTEIIIQPDYCAGLSLGEYSALVCSGSFDIISTISLVEKRAIFMNSCVTDGKYGMLAVLSLKQNLVEDIVKESNKYGLLEIANYNCPGQIVVSGELNAIEECKNLVKKNKGKSVLLKVNSPFHTSILSKAAVMLRDELEYIEIKDPICPVISNCTSKIMATQDIKLLLSKQVMSSVLWEHSIRNMISFGVKVFVEIGPGTTLTGFLKKISSDVIALNIQDLESFGKTVNFLKDWRI